MPAKGAPLPATHDRRVPITEDDSGRVYWVGKAVDWYLVDWYLVDWYLVDWYLVDWYLVDWCLVNWYSVE